MKNAKYLIALILLCACCFAMADKITLNDGKEIEGEIVADSDKLYMIKTDAGDQFITADQVKSVQRDTIIVREAKRLLKEGARLQKEAEKALRQKNYILAATFFEDANTTLSAVGKDTADLFSQAGPRMVEIYTQLTAMQDELRKKGVAIYQKAYLEAADLEKHLERGFLLFQNKFWIRKDQLCPVCLSKGKVSCGMCEGAGTVKIPCDKCRDGSIACPTCGGNGVQNCAQCIGQGKGFINCAECGGQGKHACAYCHGTGRIRYPCRECSGSGVVVRRARSADMRGNMVWSRYESLCPLCRGARYTMQMHTRCGGTGARPCKKCEGSGQQPWVCTNCKGTGKRSCPKEIRCAACSGIGSVEITCKQCRGSKKVFCANCDGKGFLGSPQEAKVIDKIQ